MSREIVGIKSYIKGNFLWVVADFPDQEQEVVIVPKDDIREAYEMSHINFHELYCDDEAELKELFFSYKKQTK